MRQLSFIAAIVACVALPSVALAAHGSHHQGGGHRADKHVTPQPAELPVGHGRYWQGQWYEEGIGPCWMGAPDGFVWICD
jgi:hypothetical protein